MGTLYVISDTYVSGTAAHDVLEIVAPSDASVLVHAIHVSQSSDTDSEQIALSVIRDYTVSGSGGASTTARPLAPNSTAAYGGTCEVGNTTQANTGTPITLWQQGVNVLSEFVWPPVPMQIIIPPSGRLVVACPTTLADALTFRVNALIEEL